MHRSPAWAVSAALGVLLCQPPPSSAQPARPSALDDARERLARNDARGAVVVLESALPAADATARPSLIGALRDAYAAAARQAEADGQRDAADDYRDNLQILNRKARPTSAGQEPVSDPAPVAVSVPPIQAAPESPATPPALTAPRSDPVPDEAPGKAVAPETRLEPTEPAPTPPTAPAAGTGAGPAAATLKAADAAFLAERYDEAGALYATLERNRSLPDGRRGHWAYCRAAEVVRRINARPSSAKEWAAIDGEIQSIRALSPSNWFAEYLRNLASERHRDPRARPVRANKKVVVRANSPEEPAAASARPAAPVPPPPPAAGPATRVVWSRQPVATANFHVIHAEKDRALAERVARTAEAAREAQVKRWGAEPTAAAWSPRCEVVVFPTARDFSRETLQPPDSPGFSTMGMNAGRIVLRRIHLRADHPNIVKAVLPHEVTHVVLADLFPHQQIPRWADEGMAVLAEPASEQSLRASDLDEPLKAGRVFRVSDLMTMDYPDARHWGLYYAQSVSLTRYLVESGTPSQFIRFVQESQRTGVDPALRQVYAISGFDDLQGRWQTFARDRTATVTASASDPEKSTGRTRR